jgi:quinoprotein dehydrogenase-associated probable ABC transporter substrate-binding protein
MTASGIKAAGLSVVLLLVTSFVTFAADRTVLRVCADPGNLPFSNEEGAGFENKVAELLASKLGVPLTYTWFPQTIGFIRNTLKAKKCDLILGAVADQEPLQSTAPYYRSAYALIYSATSELAGVDHLSDGRLKGRAIGIIAGTPPATLMAMNGLLGQSKSFPLAVDRRHDAPAERMIEQIADGTLDAGILWGPIAGYYAQRADRDLTVAPLVKESGGPQMAFPITMGVRHGDNDWKAQVNELIAEHKSEIAGILRGFGVPLVP